MKKTIMAVGLSATLLAVAPTFAMEKGTGPSHFKALASVQPSNKLSDKELGAIEGAAAIAVGGLVNAAVNVEDVTARVIRDVTVSRNNISILSVGGQRQ